MLLLNYLWIIPALPLAGAALNGLLGRTFSKRPVELIGVGSTGLSFVAALELLREFFQLSPEQIPWSHSYFTWIAAGPLRIPFELQIDQLTVVMLMVVTGVGWLIHIYSIGYMAHEGGYYRFFAYLNLFMFFMLILVMAANYPLLFVGWEGVGLSSYLLIGFYFLRKAAGDAGKKAFIVNRIGDFGFMLAMFLIFRTFHSLDFATVFRDASNMHTDALGQLGLASVICLLLFTGAVGKSAQIPLYVWLPDAMEGPTPVSALIHAATMVTAGVYVVARSHALFLHAPTALLVIAVIGCATAFFAATIGLVQNDIKKVLAYSTVSQLGYMFLACGVGSFTAGVFHLMTHAFFKALLFLAAGSVIHAMGGEQDMRKMGGLRRRIPWTYWTMLMATLAIAGAPGFSGFFSKDSILLHAFESPTAGQVLYAVGLFSAMLTAFYMFRLIFLTFHGKPRYDEDHAHVHESPKSMLAPLVILAVLSIAGGWVAAPAYVGGVDRFEAFLSPVMRPGVTAEAAGAAGDHSLELQLAAVAVTAALAGFLVAWWFYLRQKDLPGRVAQSARGPYKLLLNKYYIDEIYDAAIVRPIVWLSARVLWNAVDEGAIDRSVNGVAEGAQALGERVRRVQSGNTRSYAAWVVVGAVLVIGLLLWPLLKPALGMVR